ncbi:hypothetical protein AaE_012394, partial [Aphanomyces astaci]
GWTLIDLGAVYTKYSRGCVRHKFLPWTYLFVRAECKEAYYKLFDVTSSMYTTFFNTDLVPAIASIDHTGYIMAALTSKWSAIRTISCYIHLKRNNVRRHKHLLISNDNYDKVKGDIERMWLARTWHQFQIISTTGFPISISLRPGICGFLQPLDVQVSSPINSTLKATTRESRQFVHMTSVVLQHTIPRVLVSDQIATDTSPGLWAACPISTEVLEKALTLQSSINHLIDSTNTHVLFNSTSHFGRAERFINSIDGENVVRSTEKSIKDALLSLHAVAVNTDVHIRDDMLALTPFRFDEYPLCQALYDGTLATGEFASSSTQAANHRHHHADDSSDDFGDDPPSEEEKEDDTSNASDDNNRGRRSALTPNQRPAKRVRQSMKKGLGAIEEENKATSPVEAAMDALHDEFEFLLGAADLSFAYAVLENPAKAAQFVCMRGEAREVWLRRHIQTKAREHKSIFGGGQE